MTKPKQNHEDNLLFAKLNLETALIQWESLQRFFAQGKVMLVAPGLDLVTVAHAIASDEAGRIGEWLENKSIGPVSDEQARLWIENDTQVWALVVAPWVLVQEGR